MKFNSEFNIVNGDILTLKLIETCKGDALVIPFYYYNIYLNTTPVGKISIRIGHNRHSYYNGNLGYEIDEPYRGRGYAKLAVEMLYKVALYHKMTHLIVSCDEDNYASKKVIQKLGAIYIETISPPKNYIYYYKGMPKQSIFRINLK